MQPQYITLTKRAKDITGQRFGRLVALGPIGWKRGRIVWLCLCDCGAEISTIGKDLRSGHTKSCGCFQEEKVSQVMRQHGMTNTRIHNLWKGMLTRCNNPNDKTYHRYGGRGITVCPEWQDSFESFYSHVSRLPHYGEKGYTLDRIDNERNYEPGNIRWATVQEQAWNTRQNVRYEWNGRACTLGEWAILTGIKRQTLLMRIRRKWTIEQALTTPVNAP